MSFLANVAYSTRFARLPVSGIFSIRRNPDLLTSTSVLMTCSNLPIARKSVTGTSRSFSQQLFFSGKGTNIGQHHPSCRLQRRSLSSTTCLERRWMERQHNPIDVHPYRKPLIQHLQTVQWVPPTTPERAHLATFGLIGLFIAVWCAHNYAEGGSVLPNGVPLPKPPGWDSISEFFGFKKSKSPNWIRNKHHQSAAVLEIKNNFSTAALSYRTSDYPPDLSLNALYPFYASLFSHFEPLHLAINSYWTWAIVPTVMMSLGIPSTLALYVLGGMTAIEIQCVVDRAYALNQAPQLFKYLKSAQIDPNPNGTLGAQHLGSSGALFALGTVRALANKQRGWRLFALFAVSLDVVGYYMDLDTGVSYTSHLSGVLAGALFWATWLRWTKPIRTARMLGM